jgi:hypothetical protein
MPRFSKQVFFVISLILMTFPGVATLAGESGGDPVSASRPLTLEEFKESLPANAEELGLKGFLELREKGPVVVLDVRGTESFERRRLKGSINAPLTDLTEKNLPALAPDKDTPVVLACDYSFYPVRMIAMTLQAYPVLKANGYTHIYRLNLWSSRENGGTMISPQEQEKLLEFEGSEIAGKK